MEPQAGQGLWRGGRSGKWRHPRVGMTGPVDAGGTPVGPGGAGQSRAGEARRGQSAGEPPKGSEHCCHHLCLRETPDCSLGQGGGREACEEAAMGLRQVTGLVPGGGRGGVSSFFLGGWEQLCYCCLVAKSCPPARLLCPWGFPGRNTGVGCHFFLLGIFPSQGLSPGLLHWQVDFFFFFF